MCYPTFWYPLAFINTVFCGNSELVYIMTVSRIPTCGLYSPGVSYTQVQKNLVTVIYQVIRAIMSSACTV